MISDLQYLRNSAINLPTGRQVCVTLREKAKRGLALNKGSETAEVAVIMRRTLRGCWL